MGDEFDDCECIWSHEYAMQRLLDLIRQNQEACTDTECVDVSGRMLPRISADDTSSSSTWITTIFLLLAMAMFFVNPDRILKFTSGKRGRRDDNGAPPPPPPPAPPAVN